MPGAIAWTSEESTAWRPKGRIKPSAWIEAHRQLPADSNEKGRFSFARVPYLREVVDCVDEPGVEEVVFQKPTRIGFSVAVHSLFGFWADVDPDPCMVVMAGKDAAEEIIKHSLRPMFRGLEVTSDVRGDNKTNELILRNGMRITIGYSGSEQSLSSRNVRRLIIDEANKYVRQAAIAEAKARCTTFRYRKCIVIGSSPTDQFGAITRELEECGDRRHYHVPCPHCGRYQILQWHPGLTWDNPGTIEDNNRLANELLAYPDRVYYRCQHCHERIGEQHKALMVESGRWVSETQHIDAAGNLVGERPRARKVGFQITGLYSLFVGWAELAASFLRAKVNRELLAAWYGLSLGEPFVERLEEVKVEDYAVLLRGAPAARILPPWGLHLLCAVDTQDDRFIWGIRAFGAGQRSQLIDHGTAGTFEDLKRIAFDSPYAIDGMPGKAPCNWLVIDSGGHRTEQVYQFAASDARVICLRGSSSPKDRPWRSAESTDNKAKLHIVNTNFYKDRLDRYRRDPGQWMLNQAVDERYLQQLAAEQKSYSSRWGMWLWVPEAV